MFNFKNKKIFWLLAILAVVFAAAILIRPAQAQINIWKGLDQPGGCLDQGNCNLASGERFFLNLIDLILKFLGVGALVGFIYGGLTWITSGGSPDKVKRGKDALVGSVVGVVIVLFAYVIIFQIINVLAPSTATELFGVGGSGGTAGDDKACIAIKGTCMGTDAANDCQKLCGHGCLANKCLSQPNNLYYQCCGTDALCTADDGTCTPSCSPANCPATKQCVSSKCNSNPDPAYQCCE